MWLFLFVNFSAGGVKSPSNLFEWLYSATIDSVVYFSISIIVQPHCPDISDSTWRHHDEWMGEAVGEQEQISQDDHINIMNKDAPPSHAGAFSCAFARKWTANRFYRFSAGCDVTWYKSKSKSVPTPKCFTNICIICTKFVDIYNQNKAFSLIWEGILNKLNSMS